MFTNKGPIGTKEIMDLAVTTAKIAASAVTTPKIKALNVTTTSLAASAVTTAKIKAGNVTTTSLAASAQVSRGQTSKLLNASGRASLTTTGYGVLGVIVVPWTASFVMKRLVTKPTTSKVTMEFGVLNASGRILNASIRTVSFYYEYVKK